MSWGTSIVAACISALLGAFAWGCMAYSYSTRNGDTQEDLAWTTFFAFVFGSGGGFISGLLASRIRGASLLQTVELSAGTMTVLAVAAGVIIVLRTPVPATIGGEKLVLQVDVRFPHDWTPGQSQAPAGMVAMLTPNANRTTGTVESNKAAPGG